MAQDDNLTRPLPDDTRPAGETGDRTPQESREDFEARLEREEEEAARERQEAIRKEDEYLKRSQGQEIQVPPDLAQQFWAWMEKLREEGQEEEIYEAITKEFLLWADEQKEEERGDKIQQWEELLKVSEDSRDFIQKAYDYFKDKIGEFKEAHILLGQGPEAYAWERVMGQLLDERVQQIHSANLNARDRYIAYKSALDREDKFEAQAMLLSLGHTSDFSEEDIELYYRAFADWQEAPILDSKNVTRDDFHQAEKMADHPGTYEDFWFETKLRRETKAKGKRPDVWHSGSREIFFDEEQKQFYIFFKSDKMAGEENNADAQLTPGRKGDVAAETHDYGRFRTTRWFTANEYIKAATEILKQKKAQADIRLREHKQALAEAEEKQVQMKKNYQQLVETAPPDERLGVESRMKYLNGEVERFKKEIADHRHYTKLVDRRLRIGFKSGDFKSFLLNSNASYDSHYEFQKDGKTARIYEKDVAVCGNTFMYWLARTDRDADVICNSEHVTASERNTHAQLYNDNFYKEIYWRSRNHLFGVHDSSGKYDESRDGSKWVARQMVIPGERGSVNFSIMARGWAVVGDKSRVGTPPTNIVTQNKEGRYVKIDTNFKLDEQEQDSELQTAYVELMKEYNGKLFDATDGQNDRRILDFDFADLSDPRNKAIKDAFDKAVEEATLKGKYYIEFGARAEKLEEPGPVLSDLSSELLSGGKLIVEAASNLVKEMTKDDLKQALERVENDLKDRQANLIEEDNVLITNWWARFEAKNKPLSPRQQKQIIDILRPIVRGLQDWELIDDNVVQRIQAEVSLDEEETKTLKDRIEVINFEYLMPIYRAREKVKSLSKIVEEAEVLREEVESLIEEGEKPADLAKTKLNSKQYYDLRDEISREELNPEMKGKLELLDLAGWDRIQDDRDLILERLSNLELATTLARNELAKQYPELKPKESKEKPENKKS